MSSERGPSVCMVIVTFNRLEHLEALLACVESMTRLPDRIVVVDNASSDGTGAYLDALPGSGHPLAPRIDIVRSPDNGGFAAGLNRGLRVAAERGCTWAWLSDDDSRPVVDFLERRLALAAGIAGLGVLGDQGKVVRWGTPHDLDDLPPAVLEGRRIAPGVVRCDWTLVDGALVDLAAAAAVGPLRDDFFMMCEDMDFTTRLRRAGWVVAATAASDTERLHLGSSGAGGAGGPSGPSPSWRAYYQTRNELLSARAQRSTKDVGAWLVRTSKFLLSAVLRRQGEVVRMRAIGAWHGLRGVSGRTVEPRSSAKAAA